MKVGIFDSGIGGLTILKEVIAKYPNNQYIYLADNINLPFGEKTKEELKDILDNILMFFKQKNVDYIICACGTLSNIVEEYNIKDIYNILNPIKNEIIKNCYKNILIIGTNMTIKSKRLENLLKYDSNVAIYTQACKEFVEIIESKNTDECYIQNIVDKYIKPYVNKIDAIVLGCTHYILLNKYITNCVGNNVAVIEPAKSIAQDIVLTNDSNRRCDVYCTKESNNFNEMVHELIQKDIIVKKIDIIKSI